MKRFVGKVALVVGASSGIGRAAALLLGAEGARMILAARRGVDGEDVARTIRAAGGEAQFVQADIARAEDCQAMVDRATASYGRLDVAFNNAAVGTDVRALLDTPDTYFDECIAINLRGVYLAMKAQIRAMLASGGGAIVNTGSAAGLVGMAGAAAYSASKHGLIGLTRSAALDYATQNIRINAMCPGGIDTQMLRHHAPDPAMRQHLAQATPMGRLGVDDEPARAALFLLSDEASFITGQSLAVDGGWTVP